MPTILYNRSIQTDSMMGHVLDFLALGGLGLFAAAKLEALGVPTALLLTALLAGIPGYHVLTLRYFGGTAGQRLFGVRVVAWEGGPLSWKQSVRRVAGQAALMVLLMVTGPIGIIWLLVNRHRRQRWWHDSLAGTRLIKAGQRDPGPTPALPPRT